MTLNAWIIYNGNLVADDFLDYAEWLHIAAKENDITSTIYKNNDLLSLLTSDSLSILDTDTTPLPDFVLFTDKDIYLARQLELLGIPVFNSAKAIEISDDKIATYQTLATHNLPIPKTIIAPKVFYVTDHLDLEFIRRVEVNLGYPMIIKEAFGSFGEQVFLIEDTEQLLKIVKETIGKPFVFQEFVSTSYGKDLRLQVVGDKVVASMLRKSKNDFRANITNGGTMEKYEPTKEEEKLAIAAAQAIGADFAGVDLLFGQGDKPIICEVNSNAHIRNLYNCTGINVANDMIRYIKITLQHE